MINNMFFIAGGKMFGDLKSINSIKSVKLSKHKKYECQNHMLSSLHFVRAFSKITKNTRVSGGAQIITI